MVVNLIAISSSNWSMERLLELISTFFWIEERQAGRKAGQKAEEVKKK